LATISVKTILLLKKRSTKISFKTFIKIKPLSLSNFVDPKNLIEGNSFMLGLKKNNFFLKLKLSFIALLIQKLSYKEFDMGIFMSLL
jgi:hypothetical protein